MKVNTWRESHTMYMPMVGQPGGAQKRISIADVRTEGPDKCENMTKRLGAITVSNRDPAHVTKIFSVGSVSDGHTLAYWAKF